MISLARYVGYVERQVRERKYFKEISSSHLSYLRNHSQTRHMNESPYTKDILDFVMAKTECEAVMKCDIWSLTNKSIDDLIEHTKNNAKDVTPQGKRSFYLDMAEQYKMARAFYTLDTKEVYYITDIDDRLKDNNVKRPSKFSKTQWRKIHIRASIVHELFHLNMDFITNSRNEMMHEKHAYTGMIDWCREREGLTDDEIVRYIISTYGQRVALSRNPRLKMDIEEDRKFLEEVGYKEGMKLIKEHDVLKSSGREEEEEEEKSEIFDIFDFNF